MNYCRWNPKFLYIYKYYINIKVQKKGNNLMRRFLSRYLRKIKSWESIYMNLFYNFKIINVNI